MAPVTSADESCAHSCEREHRAIAKRTGPPWPARRHTTEDSVAPTTIEPDQRAHPTRERPKLDDFGPGVEYHATSETLTEFGSDAAHVPVQNPPADRRSSRPTRAITPGNTRPSVPISHIVRCCAHTSSSQIADLPPEHACVHDNMAKRGRHLSEPHRQLSVNESFHAAEIGTDERVRATSAAYSSEARTWSVSRSA